MWNLVFIKVFCLNLIFSAKFKKNVRALWYFEFFVLKTEIDIKIIKNSMMLTLLDVKPMMLTLMDEKPTMLTLLEQ